MGYPIKTISHDEVCQSYLAGMSRVTFWRLRKNDPTFPKPLKYLKKLVWDREQIEDWYVNRLLPAQNKAGERERINHSEAKETS